MVGRHDVIHQEGDLVYYSPFVFDKNPYHGVTVPILVVDLLELVEDSKNLCRRHYGNQFRGLFYKNHPLNKISVVGVVVGCRYKCIGDDDYIFMQLDDCSGSARFLQCKCLEPLAMENGLSWGSICGQKLRISGAFNLWYREMVVEWIDFIPDIIAEIEHWQSAIEFRRKLSIPWVEPVSSEPPTSNYIQQMHTANVMDSLVITSTYEQLSPPSPLPSPSPVDSPPPSPLPQVICNITELKIEFLRGLLKHEGKRAYTTELYSGLSTLLNQLATLRFQNQRVNLPVKPWQQLKSESLYDQLHKLQKSGLLRCHSNDNLVDLKPLKDLHEYSMHRVLTLIKLQCNTGRIDYNHIRDKLKHCEFTKKAIVDIFKESLRRICLLYPQLLVGWWIGADGGEFSVIHFKYEPHER
ncbi:ZYRO0B11330p [Zygosaccharomyces rouxii]|uniref:ZYRO0B11330p n=1 Tax=Zygosaccharomyces rouxii (strain ATCC 2623 / CBS 732 / NBRC 1130 / NCYC 568 / NRRL Y-229) TaxID=559307 RepID=C5DRU2_ZYGRC|nr:uncharacterized protein ZYRO0B11330g [Zygosaccharomyces rouxii]KAH9199966.1 telomere capping C-terminal wHTH-domain-containing protein [Zygosaccharomyces rouxii]CAR26503.1 ZYRO0B11330p [Zygosaccharomyces rouxii]